jgi:CubicO group peptidase (beta-lactamase class C family)
MFFIQFLITDKLLASSIPTNDASFLQLENFEIVVNPYIQKGFEGVIIVANEQGLIFRKSNGHAIKGKSDYSTSTVVDIASLSKQFTAAAIMKLVEQGMMDTSLPISLYIENVPQNKADITVHHLLTHTAGFKRHLGRDEERLSKTEFLNKVMALPLTFGVGEKYHYSGIGYGLLALIVENVSGQEFEAYLFENLLESAGMFATGYLRPDWSQRIIPEVTRRYAGFSSPLKLLDSTKGDFWNLKGAGGILSTAEDMALWHIALLKGKILSYESQRLMFTPYVEENDDGYYYGYGWSVVPRKGKEPLIWHNGMSFFGKAEYWRLPHSGLMIFVASHEGDVEPWHIANALFKALEMEAGKGTSSASHLNIEQTETVNDSV